MVVLGLITLCLIVGYGLAGTALWVQLSDQYKTVASVGVIALGAGLILAAFLSRGQAGVFLGVAVLPLLVLAVWWSRIEPQKDRTWAPELAQTVTADVDGTKVTLNGVRNFTWRSLSDYDEAWETRSYDLEQLVSVDAALSYWGLDKIAHVLVSFSFDDGERIVFSVEIRKEKGEDFSQLGGFFKEFELALVAATEEDILFLRTNARDPLEDVYLYPIDLEHETMQALFLSYAGLGNKLAAEPVWYNTITANCTTVIYRLVRSFNPDQGFDLRFILSGGLPEYLDERDMLKWPKPRGDIRARAAISAKAQAIQPGQSYSEVIRAE